jgi:hypothetical protein
VFLCYKVAQNRVIFFPSPQIDHGAHFGFLENRCYRGNFFNKSNFTNIIAKIARPHSPSNKFHTCRSTFTESFFSQSTLNWLGILKIIVGTRTNDVNLGRGARKSKVRFFGPKTASGGVKTLTYFSVTHISILRIFPRIFFLYTTLGCDVK